ncbi:MAG: type II secretion system secretin GspD [Betaproteobacteria bacterium]
MRLSPKLQHQLAVIGTALVTTFAALALNFSSLPPAYAQDQVTLNFINVDVREVIQAIGKHTGKNFIIDPRVTGNMSIVSQTPVNRDLAYQILLSALRVSGYATVEERGVVKIVPEGDAKTGGPVVERGSNISGDRIVTQIFSIQYESAPQLATVLRSQVPPNNFIGALPGSNMLLITDYAENVKRIGKIIAALDVPSSAELQMIKLEYASAVDIAALLKSIMPETGVNPASPATPAKLSIGVEPRTNSLIVRADTPALVTRVKALIAGIDIPTAAGGNIHVVYLRNAEASKIADTLRGLISGSTTSSVTTSPATTTPTSGAAQTTSASSVTSSPAAPSSSIQAYTATNSLVIVAPDHVYNSLRQVIDKLDSRRAQVLVEALIVEVSASMTSEFGIQWQDLSGLNRGGSQIIGGTNFGGLGQNIIGAAADIASVGGGLNIGVVRGTLTLPDGTKVLNLGALARALEANQKGNVLATPNILTLDNEEAKFVVGQNVPFVTGSFTQSSNASTNPFQTIERKDVGLTLKVTPQVTEGSSVKLKAFLEISSVVPTTATIKSADLITNKRSVENTVLVDDGQIVVIGGLIQDDTKNNESKVPLLGDIPFLGNLFKYQNRTRDKTNLMIFLRPYVLRDGKAANQLTGERYDFIRNEQGAFLKEGESLLPPKGGPLVPPVGGSLLPAIPPLDPKVKGN